MAEPDRITDADRRARVRAPETATQASTAAGMSSNSGKQIQSPAPEVDVFASVPGPLRAAPRREAQLNGRVEAQLRARVADLEAQLIEVANCLASAENRVANAQADADRAWGVVGDMANSLSWRYTSALRSAVARLRRRR